MSKLVDLMLPKLDMTIHYDWFLDLHVQRQTHSFSQTPELSLCGRSSENDSLSFLQSACLVASLPVV